MLSLHPPSSLVFLEAANEPRGRLTPQIAALKRVFFGGGALISKMELEYFFHTGVRPCLTSPPCPALTTVPQGGSSIIVSLR